MDGTTHVAEKNQAPVRGAASDRNQHSGDDMKHEKSTTERRPNGDNDVPTPGAAPNARVEAVAKLLFTSAIYAYEEDDWDDFAKDFHRTTCLMAAEDVLREIDLQDPRGKKIDA